MRVSELVFNQAQLSLARFRRGPELLQGMRAVIRALDETVYRWSARADLPGRLLGEDAERCLSVILGDRSRRPQA